MELAQTKIPYLPPEWTVKRVASYAIKLGVFIVVPGLHQIACKRRILGALLFLLYVFAEITMSYRPYVVGVGHSVPFATYEWLSVVSQIFSWILLTFDLRAVEDRKLKLGFLLPLSCVVALYFSPFYGSGRMYTFVEKGNLACPVFCKFDIIEYEPSFLHELRISAGDHIVIYRSKERPYTARILAGPPEEACMEDGSVPMYLPSDDQYCTGIFGIHFYQYLILGGWNPKFKSVDGREFSMIAEHWVWGVNPKKIGNTHEYFILSDGITDVIGNALLTVYEWTGINLFGLSKTVK